jgi:hypothetical protein
VDKLRYRLCPALKNIFLLPLAKHRWGAAAAAEGTARGWRAGTGRGKPACTSPRRRGSPWRRPAPGSPAPARTPRSTRRSATTTPSPPPEPAITGLPGGILGAAVGASLSLWCRLCARASGRREAVRRRTRPDGGCGAGGRRRGPAVRVVVCSFDPLRIWRQFIFPLFLFVFDCFGFFFKRSCFLCCYIP